VPGLLAAPTSVRPDPWAGSGRGTPDGVSKGRADPANNPAAPPPAIQPREDRKAQGQARAKLADKTRPLRNEIKQLDDKLAKLNKERADVESLIAQPGLDAQGFADQGRRLAHIQADTSRLEERWLELQQQLESMTAAAGE
jgi:ATP-binding cassette, subfamily F, member 3